MTSALPTVGDLLRQWRQRRRMSQLTLACEADVSTRHLSFVETGRALPSRDMVLHLAERLAVPLRERNALLLAAGYAPIFQERPLSDPALSAVRHVVEKLLVAHEPYPALALDRHWNLLAANPALLRLLDGLPSHLMQPPANVLRISLHPDGLAPRIANFAQWRSHLLTRLRQQTDISADAQLASLLREVSAYPPPPGTAPRAPADLAGIAVPLELVTPWGLLSFLSTTTVFGSPVDVTVAEIALETFFPATPDCAAVLQRLSAEAPSRP